MILGGVKKKKGDKKKKKASKKLSERLSSLVLPSPSGCTVFIFNRYYILTLIHYLTHLASTALSTVSGVKIFSLTVSWGGKHICHLTTIKALYFFLIYYPCMCAREGSSMQRVLHSLSFWRWQTSAVLQVRLAAAPLPPWFPVRSPLMQPLDPQPTGAHTHSQRASFITNIYQLSFSHEIRCSLIAHY